MNLCRRGAWRTIFSEVSSSIPLMLSCMGTKNTDCLTLLFSVGNPSIEPLSWQLRLKIAIGAAKGLAFLHASDKQVIYRDFKASNILLDGVRILFN